MADKQVRVDLVARDEASPVIDDVADAVADLEKLTPEVTVEADTSSASSAIADVTAEADAAARADREIVIRARIDDLKGELRTLQTELKQTGDRADDTARQLDRVDGPSAGGNLRGNAIADLTGPLGEASGAASDFAGVFDGLGDIVEETALKMGASQDTAGKVASSLGLVGVAVAGGAALWSIYSNEQKKAAERAKELAAGQKELNDALAEGNTLAAAEAFEKNYGTALDAADKLGVSVQAVTEYIAGNTDALAGNTDQAKFFGTEAERNRAIIEAARGTYATTNDTLADTDARLQAVAGAFGDTAAAGDDVTISLGAADSAMLGVKKATDEAAAAASNLDAKWDALKGNVDDDQAWLNLQDTFDATEAAATEAWQAAADGAVDAEAKARDHQQATNDLKSAVIDYGAEVLGLPPEQVTDILADIDYGSVAEAEQALDDLTRLRRVTIEVVTAGIAAGQRAVASVGGTSTSTTIVNLPAGSRGVDVLRQVTGQARRSGTRYGNAVSSHARR